MYNRSKTTGRCQTIGDWRAIHDIDVPIEGIVSNIYLQKPKTNPFCLQTTSDFPPENHALALVEFAFKMFFPRHADKIETCFATTDFQIGPNLADPNAPYTLDNGQDQGPTVVCAYRQKPEDLIALAHECAHALQISLNPGRFMTPIQREICAFLGEQILIDFATSSSPEISDNLRSVWELENQVYFGVDTDILAKAALNEASEYTYRWNYPVARLAAVTFFRERPADALWSIFNGDTKPWRNYLDQFSPDIKELGVENYYPAMPDSDPEMPALNAYRAVGAMALMDADYFEGLSQTPIDIYFEAIVKNMQAGTAFICVDDSKRPVGYATWDDDKEGATLTHRAAPFGDYLKLMKSLKDRIPNSATVRSIHERSARKEQVAW